MLYTRGQILDYSMWFIDITDLMRNIIFSMFNALLFPWGMEDFNCGAL